MQKYEMSAIPIFIDDTIVSVSVSVRGERIVEVDVLLLTAQIGAVA